MGQQVHCAFCSASGDESFFRMYHGSWACLRCIGNKEQEAKKASSGGGSSRGGSSGGGSVGGVISHALGLSETAEEREERLADEAEERAERAERKARIQAINDIVFDTENEQTFVQQVISLCEDFKGLKAGAFADKDFKTAYRNRIKKEFAVLSATKPDLLARVKGFWEEAEKAMKKKNKPRHILAFAVPIIFLLIAIIGAFVLDQSEMLGVYIFVAILFGGMIGVLIEGYNS